MAAAICTWSTAQILPSSGHFVYGVDLCARVDVCSRASVSRHTTDPCGVHLSHSTAALQLLSLRSGKHHSAFQTCSSGKGFFQAFSLSLSSSDSKNFYGKYSQLFGFFSSKRIFKTSKDSPISFISFFLFLPLTVLSYLSPIPQFILEPFS